MRLPIVLSLIVATSLAAQSPAVLGSRVRLTTAEHVDRAGRPEGAVHRWEGVLTEGGGDSVVIRTGTDAQRLAIPAAQVFSLELFDGSRTHRRRGAAIGAASGAAFGILATVVSPGWVETCSSGGFLGGTPSPRTCTRRDMTTDEQLVFGSIGTALTATLGAGVGLLIGSIPHDHWRPLPSRPARVSVAPFWSGPRVGARLTW